jgi:hypothetical protein
MIVIAPVGEGPPSYSKRCMGGVHDGETVL